MLSSRIAAIVIGQLLAYQTVAVTGNISAFASFSLNCTTLAESSDQAECLGEEQDAFGNTTDCVLVLMPVSQVPTSSPTVAPVTPRPTAMPPTLASTTPQPTPPNTRQVAATTTPATSPINGNGNSGANKGDGDGGFPWGITVPIVVAISLFFFVLGIVLGVCFNRRLNRDVHSRQREIMAANQMAMQMEQLGDDDGSGAGKKLDPEPGMGGIVIANPNDEQRYSAAPQPASTSSPNIVTHPHAGLGPPSKLPKPPSTTSLGVPIHPASRLSWGDGDDGSAPGSRRGSVSGAASPCGSGSSTPHRRKFAKEVSSVRRQYLKATEMELWTRGRSTTSSAATETSTLGGSVTDGSVPDGPGSRKPVSQSSVFGEDNAASVSKGTTAWGNPRALGSLRSVCSDVSGGSVDEEVHTQITGIDVEQQQQQPRRASRIPSHSQSGLIQTSQGKPVPAPRKEGGRMKAA